MHQIPGDPSCINAKRYSLACFKDCPHDIIVDTPQMEIFNVGLTPLEACMVVFSATVVPILYRFFSSSGSHKLLPGPPHHAFGNIEVRSPIWKRLHNLHVHYGSIISTYLGNRFIISLATIDIAKDLLDKKGNIYSSRPMNIMGDILTGGMRTVTMPYGTRWRNYRSLLQASIGVEASQNFKPLQTLESSILLHDLLSEKVPENYNSHFKRFALSVASCLSYGKRILSLDDPMVRAQEEVDHAFMKFSAPGHYVVESWPVLLKLPRFLQWFRRAPEEQRERDTKLFLALLLQVRDEMQRNIAPPSLAKRAIEKQSDFGLSDVEVAYALSSPFAAGVSTTTSVIQVALLAMLHYPDVMRKAQAEIDAVVGSDRMPDFEDMQTLPYVAALIREALRWRPIVPLGVPHSVIADDTYNGMSIPKGSTIVSNLYTMSKDEQVFSSPEVFDPDRYLKPGPHSNFYFGFGRRICPGMHVAHNSLFIVISRLLWAFNILPNTNKHGNPVLPSVDDFSPALITSPIPFTYRLEPRSAVREEIIQTSLKEAVAQGATQWL